MKYNFLILTVFLSVILFANIKYDHGITGVTLLGDGSGCICHDLQPDSTVNVWIEGPDSLIRGDSAHYKLMMTGGPSVKGGFDIAVRFGILNPADTTTYILFDELTHTSPKQFMNATVLWDFIYTAPDSIVTDTIYSVGNSVNDDGNPQPGDKWNFGEYFPVTIIDNPVNVNEEEIVNDFYLSQNYPNPFNPSTKISFSIASAGLVSIIVYDVLGNEVIIIISEQKSAGKYEIEFNAERLTSGIYFYQLKAGNFIETKKMILLK